MIGTTSGSGTAQPAQTAREDHSDRNLKARKITSLLSCCMLQSVWYQQRCHTGKKWELLNCCKHFLLTTLPHCEMKVAKLLQARDSLLSSGKHTGKKREFVILLYGGNLYCLHVDTLERDADTAACCRLESCCLASCRCQWCRPENCHCEYVVPCFWMLQRKFTRVKDKENVVAPDLSCCICCKPLHQIRPPRRLPHPPREIEIRLKIYATK